MPKDAHKRRPYSKSGLKGVYCNKSCPIKPWKAYYRHHGQYVCIGYFKTRMEAAAAYNEAMYALWGSEAYLNPITQDDIALKQMQEEINALEKKERDIKNRKAMIAKNMRVLLRKETALCTDCKIRNVWNKKKQLCMRCYKRQAATAYRAKVCLRDAPRRNARFVPATETENTHYVSSDLLPMDEGYDPRLGLPIITCRRPG